MAISSGVTSGRKSKKTRYDLLLKGGHVIDPANHLDRKMDVAVATGNIVAVDPDVAPTQAEKVVAVHGLLVTPGLVDIHVHIGYGGVPDDWYSPTARSNTPPFGVPADLMLTSGVTTVVDTGSAGAETFPPRKANGD